MAKEGKTSLLGSLSRKRLKIGSSPPKQPKASPSRTARFLASAFDFSPKKNKPQGEGSFASRAIPFSLFTPRTKRTEEPQVLASPSTDSVPNSQLESQLAATGPRPTRPRATVEDASDSDEDEEEQAGEKDGASTRHKVSRDNDGKIFRSL